MDESSGELALRSMSMLFKTNFGCYIGGKRYVSDSTDIKFSSFLTVQHQFQGLCSSHILKYNITATREFNST